MVIGKWVCTLFLIQIRGILYKTLKITFYYGFFFETTTVDYGYYETTNELVKSVNASLKKETKNDNVRLSYNVRTEKVTIHIKNGYQMVITGRMSIILGFGGKEVKLLKQP